MGAKKYLPWIPPKTEEADIYSIKALQAGNASEHQQKRALKFIIGGLCGTYDLSFRPDDGGGDRATCFAEGKRFVGLELVKMLNLTLNKEA